MEGIVGKASQLTEAQSKAVAAVGRSHSAIVEAQDHLFRALGRAQPARERQWARTVAADLEVARDAVRRHREEVQGPGGLYEEIQFEAPWLVPRVEQLVAQTVRVEAELADLARQVTRVAEGDLQPLGAIRGDAERALIMLRDLMAKETDLVFERFHEPVALD
jgi:hypothetical protein